MGREFDLVIFGLTGYAGYYVARELLLTIQNDPDKRIKNLKWAIAGRNIEKLDETLRKLNNEIQFDYEEIQKIQADVKDPDSLLKMASRANVVVNTVGPYRFFGKPVVEACVKAKTHHLDISGEAQYMEQMVLDFHQEAKEKNTFIISACGQDAIPNDIGVDYLKKHFDGTLNSVDSFITITTGPKGYPLNIGTFRSAIHEYASGEYEVRAIRQRINEVIFKKDLPPFSKTVKARKLPFRNRYVPGWNIVMASCDKGVVNRTQRHCFEEYNERPTQMETYYNVTTFTGLLKLLGIALIFATLTLCSWGRSLLEKYPHIFTFGYFSLNGPSEEQVKTTTTKTRLLGQGWSKKVDPTKKIEESIDKEVMLEIKSPDPAYRGTSTFLIQSALTIIQERENMPDGGVITPAFAFHNTSLVERFKARGIEFVLKEL